MEKNEAIKLLAIDDQPDNLTTLNAVVREALPKTLVLTATNGLAGIELAAAEDPDVILLDIIMPGMDGFEVCRRLKADDRSRDIPVVFLTALKTDTASRVKALEVGGEGFLAKPLETAELTAQIRAMTKVKAANRSQRTEKNRLEALVGEQTRELQFELTERKRVEKSLADEASHRRRLMEQSRDGIVILDQDGQVCESNRKFAEMLGYPHESMRQLNVRDWEILHPPERLIEMLRSVDDKGDHFETQHRRKDGSAYDVEISTNAASFAGQKLILCICRDMTDRKRSEEALRTAERNLRSTVDGLSAHIVVVDEHGEVILTNKSYHNFAARNGAEPSAVSEGANYLAVCDAAAGDHSEESKPFAEGIREVLSGKRQSFELEYPCHSPDEKRWFIGRVTPFAGEGPRRVIVAHENITERKQAEEAMRREQVFSDAIIESIPGAFYVLDERGGYVRWNTYQRDEIVGRSEEKTAGFSAIETIHPDDRELIGARIANVLKNGTVETVEGRVLLRGGPAFRSLLMTGRQMVVDGKMFLVGISIDITERKQAESELRRLSGAIEQSPETVVITDIEGTIQYVNPAFETTTGYTCEEAIGQNPRILKSGQQDAAFYKSMWNTLLDGRVWAGRMINKRKDGSFYTEEASIAPVEDGNGTIANFVGIKRDITQELKREEMLSQAQKMESVGRLAGGVAHDFNNLLMGITGYADLCREALPEKHPVREWVEEITREVQRSANLTRQLLAFARRQTVAPKVLDLDDAVGDMLKMLRRLIGEDIDLSWQPGAEPWSVKIDPGQVDQILANLCVNARDAIGGAGKVTIKTKNVSIDANYCKEHAEAAPGDYVMLAVSDDGCGMDHETLGKLFEPFFTTKPVGEGTGLGLATVYGIVKQNNGFINVYSEPGKGTTFRIYLPRDTSVSKDATQAATKTKNQGGTETILLVEDERSIRVTIRLFLERFGYTVIAADSPAEALRLVAGHRDHLDLMITDVVMPGMSGRELAEKLAVDYPSMKILYMSGYTANVIAHRGILDDGVHFLSKPVGRDVLAQKVREVLG